MGAQCAQTCLTQPVIIPLLWLEFSENQDNSAMKLIFTKYLDLLYLQYLFLVISGHCMKSKWSQKKIHCKKGKIYHKVFSIQSGWY